MDPAALDKELAKAGYDAVCTSQRIGAAREGAHDASAGRVASPASSPAKVSSLEAARAKRAVQRRWGLLAGAAAVALLVGGGGAQYAATWYCAQCRDDLDEARGIDPEREGDATVRAADVAIAAQHPTEV